MSYRHYGLTSPTYVPADSRTTKREYSSTTERTYTTSGPSRDYKYTLESSSTTRSSRPTTYYPDYKKTITTSTHGYTPRWYNTNANTTTTTTRIGPTGVTTRTYRY